MKTFVCKRLRLCNYLMDAGFTPHTIMPDPENPQYKLFLFTATPEFNASLARYFATDCWTAKKRKEDKL